MAITATVTITHATPSDASFSAAGAAAWDGASAHTVTTDVTGYATVADTGSYADLTGKPAIGAAWPIGSIFMTTSATDPATLLGFGTWTALPGKFLVGVATGDADFGVGASGGSTGTSFTPSGTNAISLFREAAAGTNSTSTVSGSVSVEWPTGVPTFAGTTGTATSSVNWPGAVPTFAGTGHTHSLPISHNATAAYFAATGSAWGVGTTIGFDTKLTVIGVTGTNMIAVTSSLAAMAAQTVTAGGAISWPASVPQAIASSVPAGIISWPATAPSAMIKNATAAAQVFTGVTGSVSGQTFSGVTKSIAVLPPYRAVYMWERTA